MAGPFDYQNTGKVNQYPFTKRQMFNMSNPPCYGINSVDATSYTPVQGVSSTTIQDIAYNGSLYVGSTKNIEQRFKSHNSGENLSTKSKRPWTLAKVEEYDNGSLALKREKFLKSAQGRRVLKNLVS